MLPKLTVAQQAWVKALPAEGLEMAEDLLKAKGEDWFLTHFDTQQAQMDYCLKFLD
jgi:hypothetical protein